MDGTFDDTGIVTTIIGGVSDSASAVLVQPDGKIVVAGGSTRNNDSSKFDFAVVRYLVTGTLDTAFKSAGIVTTDLGSSSGGLAATLQDDGKIVVVGVSNGGVGNDDIGVVRYNSDGTLDTSFNDTGIVTTPVSSNHDIGWGVAVQPDGKIVVAGETHRESSADIVVIRYTITGTLDTTFNNTGILTTAIGGGAAAAEVVIQPNNKIVVAGASTSSGSNNGVVTVVRYNTDGSLDTNFHNTGVVTTPIGSTYAVARSVSLQSDGKIVVAGFSEDDNFNSSFVVVRYLGDSPELTFTKRVDDVTPDPGQRITYTLTVSNSSYLTATNAVISDTLPTGLTLAGSVTLDPPNAGTIGTLPTLISDLTIPPGQQITVTFPVTVNTAGTVITNIATITSSEITSPQSGVVTITVAPDSEAPTFSTKAHITPTQGITVTTARPTFDWEDATDNVEVVSYTLTLTGSSPFTGSVKTQEATAMVTTTESLFTPTIDLPDAAYTWTVSAHDSAGNVGTANTVAHFGVDTGSDSSESVFLPIILKNND